MPFDERSRPALEALGSARKAHQSAIASTVEEVRGYLDTHQASSADPAERLAAELGVLGGLHIDTSRFASLVADAPPVAAKTTRAVAKALEVLAGLAAQPDDRFIVSVPSGADLRDVVAAALGEAGRAFGAARVVHLARNGGYRRSEHLHLLSTFGPRRWSDAERRHTPPLIVEVDGADLHVGGLDEFLDGFQKLVLVVRGEAPPAPLVRLISPGVFVAQSTDDRILERLALWEGPGIVALMPRAAARFVHDPAGGRDLAGRLTVTEVPDTPIAKRLGGISVERQRGDLLQLQALMGARGAPAGAVGPRGASDPADKLAAWLLQQADLTGVG